ncbi:MAG: hypothetical protein JNL61_19375 [Rhizobiaceae bacterium]|nr:hypothetical protein [Rhizobiaceae bacterium]
MSIVGDLVDGIVDSALKEILSKTSGAGKRRRRRRNPSSGGVLGQLEKLVRPARRQTSRKKTTRTRSTAQKRRVTKRTASRKRTLRRGKALR